MKTNVLLFEYFAYWNINDYEIDSNNDWRQKHYPHARIMAHVFSIALCNDRN